MESWILSESQELRSACTPRMRPREVNSANQHEARTENVVISMQSRNSAFRVYQWTGVPFQPRLPIKGSPLSAICPDTEAKGDAFVRITHRQGDISILKLVKEPPKNRLQGSMSRPRTCENWGRNKKPIDCLLGDSRKRYRLSSRFLLLSGCLGNRGFCRRVDISFSGTEQSLLPIG